MTTYQTLQNIRKERGAGFLVLLDPDRRSIEDLVSLAKTCETDGVDGLLVGGSLLFTDCFDDVIQSLKEAVEIPIILFPGDAGQLSRHADAVLFISIVSGRNPHYLIGAQVLAAPRIRALKLESISTAYMLVDSGDTTSVEFMSNTSPLPRQKPDIAVAHALAAEYLGFRWLYLEAGSGADSPVPDTMIRAVTDAVSIPVIVGGGIRTPDMAGQKVEAGAAFVVIGTAFEAGKNRTLLGEFASAIHSRTPAAGNGRRSIT